MRTLYRRAGGNEAFERPIDAFHDSVEADDLPSGSVPGGAHAEHRVHGAAWCSDVFGGRVRHTEELGADEDVLAGHLDLGITGERHVRVASLMSLAADDAGSPDDPEFRSALAAQLEWGTRPALHNSQPGAAVAPHAPVPRRGRGAAPHVP